MEYKNLSRFEWLILIGLFFFVWLAAVLIHYYVLQGFPNSADEWAYLYQARTFALGKISVEAHPHQELLSPFYIHTHEGRVFSIFPPGWPAILSLGVFINFPGYINPLVSAVTVVLLFQIAFKWAGRVCAWFTVVVLVCSPFFLFNAASLFSHPACLLASVIALYCLISWQQKGSWIYALSAGFAFSAAFAIRELTAISILLPLFTGIILQSRHRIHFLLVVGLGAMPLTLAYLFYNAELTGRWFYPARFLLPNESLGFGTREIRLFDYVELQHFGPLDALTNTSRNLVLLFLWTFPALPLLAFYGAWSQWIKSLVPWLLISMLLLPCAYFFYPSQGGNQYGPRFYYSSLLSLSLLSGLSFKHLAHTVSLKKIVMAVVLLAMISITTTIYFAFNYHHQIYERRTLYRLVDHFDLHNALVFVSAPSGDMTQGDLIRNTPRLTQQQVIYAWYLGGRNKVLLQSFSQRIPYIFGRNSQTGAYFLRPLSSRLGDREGFM